MQKTSYARRLLLSAVLIAMTSSLFFLSRSASVVANNTTDNGLPEGVFVGRIYYDEITDIRELVNYNIDLHEYNNLDSKYVLAGMDSALYAELSADGWQLAVDDEATSVSQSVSNNSALTAPNACANYTGGYAGYRCVTDMYSILNSVNAANPTITELIDYGDSYCKGVGGCNINGSNLAGFDLLALRLGNEANPDAPMGFGNRPVFFLQAAIHAREMTTSEQALFFIDDLIAGYGVDPDITWFIDWHDIYVIPVANPDGRWVMENVNPPSSQRKNAHNNGCTLGSWGGSGFFGQPGIDLNRNSSFGWGGSGTSTDPCSLVYRGTGPASEPEVASLQTFIASLIPDQRGPAINDPAPANTEGFFITMHSYSNLIIWPWGGDNSISAPNNAGLSTIGNKLSTFTDDFGSPAYTACQTAPCLYEAAGATDDWVYGELGVPSYTYEIGSTGEGFFPSFGVASGSHRNEIQPTLNYVARIARTPYMQAYGPDVDNLSVSSFVTNVFNASATIDEGENGGQSLTAAECYIDDPYWNGGTPIPMTATDGAFNEVSETASCLIDVCTLELANGQHTVWVRGLDSAGNWGPMWAEWFTVTEADACQPLAVNGVEGVVSAETLPTTLIITLALLTTLTLGFTAVRKN